jgi:hypothetical protein
MPDVTLDVAGLDGRIEVFRANVTDSLDQMAAYRRRR